MKQKILFLYNFGKIYLLQNRSLKQTLLKNTFWMMFGEGVAKLLLFFNLVLITRYLGAEKYGILSFAFSFTALFGIIVDFGFNNYVTREISQNPKIARKYIDNILLIKIILSIITFILIAITIHLLGKTSDVIILVYGAAIYTFIQSFIVFFQTLFQSYEKMQHVFISRVLFATSLFLIILLIIHQELSVQEILLGYIISSAITFIAVIVSFQKFLTTFFVEFDFSFWKKIMNESWPFFAGIICVVIYVYLDITLVSIFRSYKEVGLYQAADKIIIVFQSLNIIHQVLYPRLSSLYGEKSIDKYKKVVKTIMKLSFIFLIPFGILVSIFSKEILFIIYGKDFVSANIALIALMWTAVLGFFNSFWGNTLMIINNQKAWFYAVLAGAIINVILNLIFIPSFGYNAAAFITIISEAVIVIVSYFMCPKYLRNF